MNLKRIEELEKEKVKILEELKLLRGYSKLSIPNAEKLQYPLNLRGEVVVRYISPSRIGDVVRQVLTPQEKDREKGKLSYIKSFKDITKLEHKAICDCVSECIEVIDKYSKKLHPYGIAEGEEFKSEDDFFRKEMYENTPQI